MTLLRIHRWDSIFQTKTIIYLLWLFLLVFPKGGIKIAGVPITWGYLLLGIVSLFILGVGSWSVTIPRTRIFLCLIPFQLVASTSMILNGVDSMSWFIAFWISFLFIPFVFLFLLSEQIDKINLPFFLNILRKGILFISYYGILLFIYKQNTGKYFEIPYLIVNSGDLGMLDNFKCNSRGIVSKLISTYNNGQLFGISIIMFLPLYCYIEKKPWNRFIVKAALFLTLSRTTWIGLLLHELFYTLIIKRTNKKDLLLLTAKILILFATFLFVIEHYKLNPKFLLDTNLGGRREQLDSALETLVFFPYKPFNGISEMTYMSISETFGMVGLISYTLGMWSPVIFYFNNRTTKIRTCSLIGILIYLIISFSDGATLYIPVLAFFWLLISLMMRKDLDFQETLSQQELEKETASMSARTIK